MKTNLSNELTGSGFGAECEWHSRSVNWWIYAGGYFCRQPKPNVKTQASGCSFRDAPPGDKNQGSEHHDRGGNVADARVNRRRKGGWQAGIQHAFESESESCHNSPQRIDHRGNA